MTVPVLNRQVAVDRRVETPDGAGGLVESWVERGVLWAEVRPRGLRAVDEAGRAERRQRWQVTLRAVAAERPDPGNRLRVDGRVMRVLSVVEDGRDPGLLICQAEEVLT